MSVGAGINILLAVALTYVGLIARSSFPINGSVNNEHAEMMVLRTFTELVPPEFQIAVLIAFASHTFNLGHVLVSSEPERDQ